jgi:hypothetical protein
VDVHALSAFSDIGDDVDDDDDDDDDDDMMIHSIIHC